MASRPLQIRWVWLHRNTLQQGALKTADCYEVLVGIQLFCSVVQSELEAAYPVCGLAS